MFQYKPLIEQSFQGLREGSATDISNLVIVFRWKDIIVDFVDVHWWHPILLR